MQKKLCALLAALVMAAAGCAGTGQPPSSSQPPREEPPGESSAPAPEPPEPPAEPSGQPEPPEPPAEPSGQPEPTSSQPEKSLPPRADDQTVREILQKAGAVEETAADGSQRLVCGGPGLLGMTKSWRDPVELTPMDYFEWFRSTANREDRDYPHPGGEECAFYPQDLYEERIQSCFDISTDHLRGDPRCYDPELKGYWRGGGGGRGDRAELSYTCTQSDGDLIIQMTRTYPSGAPVTGRMLVQLDGDGGWKYRWVNWYPPQVFPQEGSSWEELEGLTPEQRQLAERGEALVRLFQVDSSGIPGDSYDNAAPYETRELDGTVYTRYRGSLYRGWEDFQNDLLTVFTPEFFQELNRHGGRFGRGVFTGEEGTLYLVEMGRGTDRSYLADRTRYRVEGAGEDRVRVLRYAYYCGDTDDPEQDPEPVSWRECPITLVNTPDGWRVAELTLPY